MYADATTISTLDLPSSSEIAARAHEIWQEEGCPEGHDLEHWLKAEAQIRAEKFRAGREHRQLETDVLPGGKTAR